MWSCHTGNLDTEYNHKSQAYKLPKSKSSVPNSSNGLIFVKIRAKEGCFFGKNTRIGRANRRAKFKFSTKRSYIFQKFQNLAELVSEAREISKGTIPF